MKVVFMGTPDFAIPTLKALVEHHEVIAVVTQPDKPKGRGKKLAPSPVKEVAMNYNIPVLQPDRIKDKAFTPILAEFNADVFIVIAYGQILSQEILDMPKHGCINVHGSLLPEYRGAAPIHKAILDGKKVTGITTMYMDKGLDTGDMILKGELPIGDKDTVGILHDKMAILGANLLIETLEHIENDTVTRKKQDDSLSSYASMITKEMGLINWSDFSHQILNQIRGLNPWPVAYTHYNDETIKIFKAREFVGICKTGEIGEVVSSKNSLVVQTASSAIEILEVQGKNGKRMSCEDYLRGHKIQENSILN